MNRILFMITFLLCYPLGKLQALPTRCPQLDSSIIQSNQKQFSHTMGEGATLILNDYRWDVIEAKNLDPSLSDDSSFVFSSSRPGVNARVTLDRSEGRVACSYKFQLKDQPVAQLTLETDDSLRLPEHSFKRWSEVTNKADEAMEKEEKQVREDPRIRLE